MAWYSVGNEGVAKNEQEEQKRQDMMNTPRRFWIKPQSASRVVFLDSEGLEY